jgi:predicted transcriptional regulator
LAVAILVESRIHDLERSGLVLVQRNENGTTVINLTEKGKVVSRNIQRDIRE